GPLPPNPAVRPFPRAARALHHRCDPPSPMPSSRRLPIPPRHAFALALDLAVRRDALQSLWVPLLLHAPWLLMLAVLPAPDQPGGMTPASLQVNSVTLLGDFLVSLLVAAMRRFRARSVYSAAPGAAQP